VTSEPNFCNIRKIGKLHPEKYETISRILNALGNKTRISILEVISKYKEVCTCELQPALGIPQPTVTSHLHKMYNSGILRRREVWRFTYYSLNPQYAEMVNIILSSVSKNESGKGGRKGNTVRTKIEGKSQTWGSF
jgi:DNA-binding transcriptional ArsR family regulator